MYRRQSVCSRALCHRRTSQEVPGDFLRALAPAQLPAGRHQRPEIAVMGGAAVTQLPSLPPARNSYAYYVPCGNCG